MPKKLTRRGRRQKRIGTSAKPSARAIGPSVVGSPASSGGAGAPQPAPPRAPARAAPAPRPRAKASPLVLLWLLLPAAVIAYFAQRDPNARKIELTPVEAEGVGKGERVLLPAGTAGPKPGVPVAPAAAASDR